MLSNDSSNVEVMLGNPKKALLKISVPLIISLLISSLYNLIDAAWVSGLGADALAGVGFFTPIFMILVGYLKRSLAKVLRYSLQFDQV